MRKGGSILCEATGPRGERVLLVLDAQSGKITSLKVIGFAGRLYQGIGAFLPSANMLWSGIR